jgi:hypothetical protein
LRAYLLWEETWGNAADPGRIGEGTRPEQNPPPLDEHSMAVYRFFNESVNSFVMEFGLMPDLVRGAGISKAERPLFLAKMNMIYEHTMKMARKETNA